MREEQPPRLGPLDWGNTVTVTAGVSDCVRQGDGGSIVAFDDEAILVELRDGTAHRVPYAALEPWDPSDDV